MTIMVKMNVMEDEGFHDRYIPKNSEQYEFIEKTMTIFTKMNSDK